MSLVHSSRCFRSLSSISLKLPFWVNPLQMFNIGCYTHLRPIFQSEFNHDINLVIGLTKFDNFWKLVHIYMHPALIFNVDPAVLSIWWLDWPHLVIWRIGTHVYVFNTNFQWGFNHNGEHSIQCHNIWYKYGLNISFQSDFNHDVLYAIWRLISHII